jgi:regulation of enolase protein 1 (concanavalin A-like superfamily)
MKNAVMITMLFLLSLAGCSKSTEIPPTKQPTQEPTQISVDTEAPATDTPEPTKTDIPATFTAEPTGTPLPTATPEPPTLTPLPEGTLFREDFEGYLQSGWTWVNEDATRWSFVEGGWLEIIGGDEGFYFQGNYGMPNFLTRDVPDGEFMITAHVQSNPNEDFQQAAIYIYEDQSNYVAINIGYCGPCGGPGFFMETIIDNNPFKDAYMDKRSPNDTDVYLRLVSQGGSIIGYYATSLDDWQKIGAFGNYYNFKYVGLGTTNLNVKGVEKDIVSRFDYFEISLP